jgi:hypothetical protein
MSIAKSLYPDSFKREYSYVYDYDPIVTYLGETLVCADIGDYQGDIYLLLRTSNGYGFVVIGYGSCSGCDALQACKSYEDVDNLIDSIQASMKTFDTLADAQLHIANDDYHKFMFYRNESDWQKFRDACLSLDA